MASGMKKENIIFHPYCFASSSVSSYRSSHQFSWDLQSTADSSGAQGRWVVGWDGFEHSLHGPSVVLRVKVVVNPFSNEHRQHGRRNKKGEEKIWNRLWGKEKEAPSERWQVQGKHESDDITPCSTMTLIRGGGTHNLTDTHRCAHLVTQLWSDGDKSPHACSAAGTNVSTVYTRRREREIQSAESEGRVCFCRTTGLSPVTLIIFFFENIHLSGSQTMDFVRLTCSR